MSQGYLRLYFQSDRVTPTGGFGEADAFRERAAEFLAMALGDEAVAHSSLGLTPVTYRPAVVLYVEAADPDAMEALILASVRSTEFSDIFLMDRPDQGPSFGPDNTPFEATFKTVEVSYTIGDLACPATSDEALTFRNAAMAVMEDALTQADAGVWSGAEIGVSREPGGFDVSIAFEVTDFDAAETIVHRAVQGTPYAAIREIRWREFEADDLV